MKMYIGKDWYDKIEIKEFEIVKETEKRYYFEDAYIDKKKMNRWNYDRVYSTDKKLLLSIIKNHYIEENEKLEEKIKNNNVIIENAYKMQMELKI